MSDLRVVGTPVSRADALAKVTGRARYAADVSLPGMLHAKVLRSPHAHARLKAIDASRARALDGVHAVITRDDIVDLGPAYGYIKDQPVVAIDTVRYIGDIVAAVAAADEETALRALELIEATYEPLPAIATIAAALARDAPPILERSPEPTLGRYGPGGTGTLFPQRNVLYEFAYEYGSPEVWQGCDYVFEDSFEFSRMNHFHLEPFVSVASVEGDQFEVWTSTQSPFWVRKQLARIFNHPENKIRVLVSNVGGGFGAKGGCRTEPIAIRLAQLAGRPVRYCLTTEEAFLTLSQHGATLRLKTGVRGDGTLVARESEVVLNAGAYSDTSPLVTEKAGYRMSGPYRWEHVRSRAKCVMTNTTPAGPFRGYGGPQAIWAGESQIDMIARRLRMDPYRLRAQNLKGLGDTYAPGESPIDSDLLEGLDVVAEAIGYQGRSSGRGRGVGLAVGFKDGGGGNKAASARVKVAESGDVLLQCSTVEIGQGAHTALAQIAAEILGVPFQRVAVAGIDTHSGPYDQGTNASSGIVLMGRAVADACTKLKRTVLEVGAGQLGCDPGELRLEDGRIRRGDDVHALSDVIARAYGSLGFEFAADGFSKAPQSGSAPLGVQTPFWEIGWAAAEVEVDVETGLVTVLQLVVSGDAGRAIHAASCRGQDEGGAIMGLSQAMIEQMRFDGPRLVNGEALDYPVAMAGTLPTGRFESILQEQGHGRGPFGAKGMGEGGVLPVPAAIANAVHDAIGIRVAELPLTPDRVLAAIRATGVGAEGVRREGEIDDGERGCGRGQGAGLSVTDSARQSRTN